MSFEKFQKSLKKYERALKEYLKTDENVYKSC